MQQFLGNGVCSGAVYALNALGFGLIYSTTRTFHVAHGAVVTAAAYACFFTLSQSCPLAVAVLVGVLTATILGVSIEALIYHPLVHVGRLKKASPTIVMISSIGTYTVVVHIIALIFGNDTKVLRPGAEKTLDVGGAILTYVQISQLIVCLLAVIVLHVLFRRSRHAKAILALADDPELVSILGYNVRTLRLAVFAIGSALAGLAGVLSALDVGADPYGGFHVFLIAAVATIVGGVGRLNGPIVGAMLLGVSQSVFAWQISARWSMAVVFALLVVVLLFRPEGVLGVRRRMEES